MASRYHLRGATWRAASLMVMAKTDRVEKSAESPGTITPGEPGRRIQAAKAGFKPNMRTEPAVMANWTDRIAYTLAILGVKM